LSSYSPQEEFYCSLGVDSGIRIDYKPVKKFIGQTGLINKFTNVTYTQVKKKIHLLCFFKLLILLI